MMSVSENKMNPAVISFGLVTCGCLSFAGYYYTMYLLLQNHNTLPCIKTDGTIST